MKHDGPPLTPPAAPSGAAAVFGERLALAERFAAILADTGVSHGLLGPREVPRLWARHLLNCAVVEDAFPEGARLVDVGSGAGLPGVALAVARPDLEVHLVEPMLRRTTWLEGVVRELGLDRVTVHRGRAEELAGTVSAPWVTARAVARLDKLAGWCVPLLEPGGTLVAMKGRSAREELAEDRPALEALGLSSAVVSEHGATLLEEPVLTVDLVFDGARRPAGRGARGGRGSGARSTSGGRRSGRRRRPGDASS
ncbi:MAG: 16S rRNA (guanine(527)-N(7))-methyltransferase RsmG [Micrococcales bacterium]|nr:16S rRNA (guanine(527)-N(7))-methyltransferase RsmG [Micrococcales bacterium]